VNIKDGIYDWPQNRQKWGKGSERPAANDQKKLRQVPPLPTGPKYFLDFD